VGTSGLAAWARPDNFVRSALALLVVVFSGLFVFGRWPSVDVAVSESRAAIVAGVVGTILGDYFGSRGVERAEARATDAVEGKVQVKAEAAQVREEVQALARNGTHDAMDRYDRLLDLLDREADLATKEKVQEFLAGIGELRP
jgi:hypothetical protein